jgi:3D (Asp-Asp-Asp) domain-containing protein
MDYPIPAEDQPIPTDGQIQIVKVHEEYILENETIPFGIEFVPSQEINLDDQQVLQTGEYGILAKRIRVVYEDDKEISRTVSDTWTAKSPTPRKVGFGTKVTIQTQNTSDGPIQYYRAVDVYATSYSPCRLGIAGYCSNRTASGAELKKGVIGVIRPWYNYMKGASVYIPGYGFATIEDIGAGFSDRHWVDLGYSDEDWVSWSRYVTVYFLLPIPENILFILN